jgi:hypothetical protein
LISLFGSLRVASSPSTLNEYQLSPQPESFPASSIVLVYPYISLFLSFSLSLCLFFLIFILFFTSLEGVMMASTSETTIHIVLDALLCVLNVNPTVSSSLSSTVLPVLLQLLVQFSITLSLSLTSLSLFLLFSFSSLSFSSSPLVSDYIIAGTIDDIIAVFASIPECCIDVQEKVVPVFVAVANDPEGNLLLLFLAFSLFI